MKTLLKLLKNKYYHITTNTYMIRGFGCRSAKQLVIKSACWSLLVIALSLFSAGLALFEKAKHDPYSKQIADINTQINDWNQNYY